MLNLFEIDDILSNLFMDTILDYDAYSQAIKLAKERGMSDDDCKPLLQAKSETKSTMEDNNRAVLKIMPKHENVIRIKDSWFGVRYVNEKGEPFLKNQPLVEKEIYIVSMEDGRTRDLTKSDVDKMLPIIVDEQVLKDREAAIYFRACELLFECMGIEVIPDGDAGIVVSAHAMERWGQRKLGMSRSQSHEYKKTNYQQLQTDITNAFGVAELLWTDEENYQYYWDDENIVYIFKDNVIVTLYEKDYGFTKEINRMITLEQLKVMQSALEKYKTVDIQIENELSLIDDKDAALAAQLKSLQAQMDLVASQRKTLETEKNEKQAIHTAAFEAYQAEFAKLFKKWDMKETE